MQTHTITAKKNWVEGHTHSTQHTYGITPIRVYIVLVIKYLAKLRRMPTCCVSAQYHNFCQLLCSDIHLMAHQTIKWISLNVLRAYVTNYNHMGVVVATEILSADWVHWSIATCFIPRHSHFCYLISSIWLVALLHTFLFSPPQNDIDHELLFISSLVQYVHVLNRLIRHSANLFMYFMKQRNKTGVTRVRMT